MEWVNETDTNDFTGYQGFIYRIDYEDGFFYYGKKDFTADVKTPLGKKALAEITDARKKNYKRVLRETNWRKYEGSNDSTGFVIKSKTILRVCKTKRELTFREAEILFTRYCLFDMKCLNKNILGKFFRNVCLDKE